MEMSPITRVGGHNWEIINNYAERLVIAGLILIDYVNKLQCYGERVGLARMLLVDPSLVVECILRTFYSTMLHLFHSYSKCALFRSGFYI